MFVKLWSCFWYLKSLTLLYIAINYYSDRSLSTFVNRFLNQVTKLYWQNNKYIITFYKSMVDKHLKLKVMSKNALLGEVNAKVKHKH